MPARTYFSVAALAAVSGLTAAAPAITIPTTPVGNAGNAPESTPNGPFGGVGYVYNVGATEVTNTQYAAFLNAVGATDTQNLYSVNMTGIARAGVSGSYSYSTIGGRASHPVDFVSFWDAARFANWLHNGQPTGPQNNSTTENGAYTLTPAGIAANSVTRNSGWQWAVTSSNEWYKAAYHQPASQFGDSDDYWLYPTSSNTAPAWYEANYQYSPPTPLPPNDTVAVQSYPGNFYGAYDMAGNVYEWSESILSGPPFSSRGYMWGGAFDNVSGWLTNQNAYGPPVTEERAQIGFRVVELPGPGAAGLLVIAAAAGFRRKR